MSGPLCVCGCPSSEHVHGTGGCGGSSRDRGGRLRRCKCKGFRKAIAQLDPEQAKASRDDAIRRVDANAKVDWKDAADTAVYQAATLLEHITTDDVWTRIPEGVTTHNNKAMGARMTAAAKRGWIERTPVFRATERPERNGAPVRVWRSLIYES